MSDAPFPDAEQEPPAAEPDSADAQYQLGVRKLAEDDKVLAVIGPFSSAECRVVFPVAERTAIVSTAMGGVCATS